MYKNIVYKYDVCVPVQLFINQILLMYIFIYFLLEDLLAMAFLALDPASPLNLFVITRNGDVITSLQNVESLSDTYLLASE